MSSLGSAVSGAATGAATGSAISPGLGTVIGAGLGLVGGLFGNYAQDKANKQNIQLQRETNDLNAKLARENYQLQRDLLERNLLYASPAEQRRMLQEAGYNPYDFVGGSGSKPVAATPIPQLPTLGSATVQPVNAMANQLGVFGSQFAEMYKTLEEGKKMKSERVGTDIDNQTRLQQNLAILRQMGLTAQASELENEYNTATMEGRIESVNLDNLLKNATSKLTDQQRIEFEIRNKFAPMRNYWEVQNLVNTAKLLVEQGKTEITKQELNRSGVRKSDAEALLAIVRQYVEKQVGSAQANYYNSSAARERSEHDINIVERRTKERQLEILNKFGFQKAYEEVELLHDQRIVEQKKINEIQANIDKLVAEKNKLYYEAIKTNLDNDWRQYEEFMRGYDMYMDQIRQNKSKLPGLTFPW